MDRYRKLIANLGVFALGNTAVQVLSLAMLPFYTRYLSTTEYGTVDIAMTTLALLVPVASISVSEAVLRFAMDSNYSQRRVLSTGIAVAGIGALVAFVTVWLLRWNGLISLPQHFMGILVAQMLQILLAQYARARGRVVLYVASGIVLAAGLAGFNVVFIAFLGMGVSGYMLGVLFANMASVVVLVLLDGSDLKRLPRVSPRLARELVAYSIPLVPNAAMWWLINGSSRYVLLYVEGLKVVGLYAIASRVPSVLSMLTLVFGKAWQQAAFEEYNSESRSRFYSRVFEYLVLSSLLAVSLVLVLLKPAYLILIASEFVESWIYVPILILAVVFQSFASFFGTNYSAAMRTGGALTTSLAGGVASVVLSVILVPLWGGMGASVAVMGGFLVMWLARVKGTRAYVRISAPSLRTCLSSLIVGIQIGLLYSGLPPNVEFLAEATLFGLLVTFNWGSLATLVRFLRSGPNGMKSPS